MHARKNILIGLVAVLMFGWVGHGMAATDRYVSLTGSNLWPFTNWDMAATNLRLAVNTANSNNAVDTVWVSTGVHSVPITIIVSNTIVRGISSNVADVVINAGGVTQCFVLRHTNAMLDKLTLSNGYYTSVYRGGALTIETGTVVNAVLGWSSSLRGGGVMLRGATKDSALVDRCLIVGNSASMAGGGVVFFQGSGTMRDSTIMSNVCDAAGAGISYGLATNCDVLGCIISGNTSGGNGGGIYYNVGVTGQISNCTIEKNVCEGIAYGAGVYMATLGEIKNSLIVNNSSSNYAGGIAVNLNPASGPVRSCLIAGNFAATNGGGYYCRHAVTLENCTIVTNTAVRGGGMYLFNDAASVRTFRNCIVYDNWCTTEACDIHDGGGANVTNMFYHCASSRSLPVHQGNTTNEPLWLAFTNGNYRLQQPSPCVNTGTNESWMADALDLDGLTRKDRFSGKVDMGAYEFMPEGLLFMSK